MPREGISAVAQPRSGFTADPQMAHVEYFTLVFYLAKQVLSEILSNNISTRYKSIHILCLSLERKHHKLCLQNRLQKKKTKPLRTNIHQVVIDPFNGDHFHEVVLIVSLLCHL